MALPININDLINGNTVEWERIEFKKGWNKNTIMHTITAFANDINNWGGGYIIVGIEEENGRPILPPTGINKHTVDQIQKDLLNLCFQLKPNYFPVAEPLVYQGKTILIIWAPGGQNRPYSCPGKLTEKRKEHFYYVRRYSNTVKAKENEKIELYELAGKIPFDDRINHHSEILDIKHYLIREFLYEINSRLYEKISEKDIVEIGKQMNIIDGSKEFIKPKNIGLMMFNEEPHQFFPYARIELVQFQMNKDVFSEKIFKGPLNLQIQETLRYISNMIIQEKITKIPGKAEAVRIFNYPYEALEEAIVNAVYHKSYEIREPIEIRIYQERIIVLNYPGPDKSIKQKDLENGEIISRRYRNRRIGEFLKELKLTEGRSTGIPKIYNAMKANGSPPPIIKTDEDRSFFWIELKINNQFLIQEEAQEEAQEGAQDKDLTKIEKAILSFLSKKSVSKAEIAEHLGYKKTTGNFKKAIKKLLAKGYIEYTIPDKPTSKNQKYRKKKSYSPLK